MFFNAAATDLRSLYETKASEWRIRWTTQVCTWACGKTAVIASGKPFRPSTTAISTSSTPRLFSSFMTRSQNLAPSLCSIQSLLQLVKQAIFVERRLRIRPRQQLIEQRVRDNRLFASCHAIPPPFPSSWPKHEVPDTPRTLSGSRAVERLIPADGGRGRTPAVPQDRFRPGYSSGPIDSYNWIMFPAHLLAMAPHPRWFGARERGRRGTDPLGKETQPLKYVKQTDPPWNISTSSRVRRSIFFAKRSIRLIS
ncbi:conserved hypothetical protein [Candidatus Defluviicoccus seviourii]|uniref:Uncharacterized protein n=1 Tax=Candidatus Defluviicoccus seviourii TaxID=2565273 RepID=A0A564WEA9_9PROT|nr:conserved hypothetical protein [Candidatus Defluviicoccus seviourii]